MRSPFTFAKILDVGTSEPVIARTVIQADQLLNVFPVPEEFRLRVTQVMREVERRLVDCLKASQQIRSEIEAGKREFGERLAPWNPKQRLPSPPWVMRLDSRLESFLYSAKLALRDISGILTLFCGENFGHRFDRAAKWAQQRFGKDAPVTQVLTGYQPWAAEICDMRNAVEHSGEQARHTLHIENFRVETEVSSVNLHEPVWFLDSDPPSLVSVDLPSVVERLLRFSEELYVTSLIKRDTPIQVHIVEIPESERDGIAPVRFRAFGYLPKSGA